MNLLYEVVHGSHLYGTNTSDSDLDIKGVYAPYSYDVLCGEEPALNVISKANKRINEKSDKNTIERKYYSLAKFYHLLSKGDIGCTEMLFARNFATQKFDNFIKEILDYAPRYMISKKIVSFIHCANNNIKNAEKSANVNDINIRNKSLYNAVRLNMEVQELVNTGKIKFPLTDREYLLNIRNGNVDYQETFNQAKLMSEQSIELINDSNLSDTANMGYAYRDIEYYYRNEFDIMTFVSEYD
jgi:predicted nucleotidyltransferase